MPLPSPTLLAVPNVSEGTDRAAIAAIGAAFQPARLLDVHSDPDHGRSVFTLAGRQGELAGALVAGARETLRRVDLTDHGGSHPHVGALDVVPVVYLDDLSRGAACAEGLTAAALIGEDLGLPVFLYGELATDPSHRERAALRDGGPARLAVRLALEAVDQGLEMTLDEGLVLEANHFGLLAATQDMKEGTAAFLEKRAAKFQGR